MLSWQHRSSVRTSVSPVIKRCLKKIVKSLEKMGIIPGGDTYVT
jgi:hypothetical protein